MKRFGSPILSLAAPLLLLMGMLGLFQKESSDRLKSLPALVVGAGLIISGALGRRYRRQKLLVAIRKNNGEEN